MLKKLFKLSYSVALLMLFCSAGNSAMAQEETQLPLPPAPTNVTTEVTKPELSNSAEEGKRDAATVKESLQNLNLSPISGKVPYYIDKGVTMIPIRPICEFLGLDISYKAGSISISGTLPSPVTHLGEAPQKTDDNQETKADKGYPIFVNFRDGSRVAQIIEGTRNHTATLDLAPETRLGVTFVPLRFLSVAFNAKVAFNAGTGLITVQSGDRLGYLRQPDQCGADTKKTVNLTVVNRVGKAFTLQLKGPCNFRIELGRLQKVAAKLPAGLYEYTAVSKDAYPRHGKRWLRSGATVDWTFGG